MGSQTSSVQASPSSQTRSVKVQIPSSAEQVFTVHMSLSSHESSSVHSAGHSTPVPSSRAMYTSE